MNRLSADNSSSEIDFAQLYDLHPEYDARRREDSPEKAQIQLEVEHFKLPYLLRQLNGVKPRSVLEIGCATGELIGAFPTFKGGTRMGVDISPRNVEVARERFPLVQFKSGDFRQLDLPKFDVVILSDILEHVSDDANFLLEASQLSTQVLVNLPLECNWLNRNRAYGPTDISGHLRSYDLNEGLDIFRRAGLEVRNWQQVWVHETETEKLRRDLRIRQRGRAFAGGPFGSRIRQSVSAMAILFPVFGRRLFASNLFVLASKP